MERDIHFRAWDKKKKKMIDNLLSFYKLDGGISHSNEFNSEDGYMWNSRNLIIMQNTGLRDKKGVEIFEGDKVSLNGKVASVRWGNGKWVSSFPEYDGMDNLTIIGNLFE